MSRTASFSLLVVLVIVLLEADRVTESSTSANYHNYESELIDNLAGPNSRYNRTVIPATTCSRGEAKCHFVILCRLFLIRIQDIIENTETLITTVRLQLGWKDLALQWNPDDYGGIKTVILPPAAIWSPDLEVANSVEDMYNLMSKDSKEHFGFRVNFDGSVWYHPTGKIHTRCALDLTFYPFDYQRCSIVVESAIYTANELVTTIRDDKSDPVSLGMYAKNPMWSLVNTTAFAAKYMTGKTTGFSRIHFWLVLKRKPDYFQQTFLIPTFMLSVLQALTYLAPMKFIDRIPQATVVLLTAFFLQGYIAEQLPKTTADAYVQIYVNVIIALSVVSVAICTITSELVDHDQGLSLWGLQKLSVICRRNRPPEPLPSPYDNVVGIVSTERKKSKCLNLENLLSQQTRRRLRRSVMIAAVINWTGFVICILVSILYPVLVFAVFVPNQPPPLPEPTPDNITKSYYAE